LLTIPNKRVAFGGIFHAYPTEKTLTTLLFLLLFALQKQIRVVAFQKEKQA